MDSKNYIHTYTVLWKSLSISFSNDTEKSFIQITTSVSDVVIQFEIMVF